MTYNKLLLHVISFIAVFLFGFALGRRIGKREGRKEGICLVPLEWKKKMYETSTCPLCLKKLNVHKNYDNVNNQDL